MSTKDNPLKTMTMVYGASTHLRAHFIQEKKYSLLTLVSGEEEWREEETELVGGGTSQKLFDGFDDLSFRPKNLNLSAVGDYRPKISIFIQVPAGLQ